MNTLSEALDAALERRKGEPRVVPSAVQVQRVRALLGLTTGESESGNVERMAA